MCVYSMIIDHYEDKWKPRAPYIPAPFPPYTPAPPIQPFSPYIPAPTAPWPIINPPEPKITPDEIAEFKKLLERAKEYDKRNNEPDCELEEKKIKLKTLAKELGINLDFV